MIWDSTARILAAFLTAGLVVWFAPALLSPLGLSEFVFLGQLCLTIFALSILELVFSRLPGSPADHEIGHKPPDP